MLKSIVRRSGKVLGAAALLATLATPIAVHATTGIDNVPAYDHVWLIMMENHPYSDIIGSASAPYINSLASNNSTATNYLATTHDSMPNYLDVIAGSDFGIGAPFDPNGFENPNISNDFSPCNANGTPGFTGLSNCIPTITSPSLIDQLQAQSLTWKSYQESIPSVGSNWANSTADGTIGGSVDNLYAVKHNPFMYFSSVISSTTALSNVVGFDGLTSDLNSGNVPNFSFIAPNQCDDMHGDTKSASPCKTYTDAQLIQQGDTEVQTLVTEIKGSSAWNTGKNAIIVMWDENDYGTDQNQVPFIVVTNQNTGHIVDNTLYNGGHYSLTRTLEDVFGISAHLNNAQYFPALGTLFGGSATPPGNITPAPYNILPTPELPSATLFGAGIAVVVVVFARRRRAKR